MLLEDPDAELHELIVLDILRVSKCVALPYNSIVNAVQEHIHLTQRPCLVVDFLTVNSCFMGLDFIERFQQQTAASAGRIEDTLVLLWSNKLRSKH